MTTTTSVAERIASVFKRLHAETDEQNREATKGPFKPYGEPYDDHCWSGTIREAWEQEKGILADAVNDAREDEGLGPLAWDQWEGNEAAIEAGAKDAAQTVVGSGRPIYIAFCDGQYPAVFCDDATDHQIEEAAAGFYPDED